MSTILFCLLRNDYNKPAKKVGKYLSEKHKQIIIWQFTFQICSIDRTSTIRHLLECNLISDKNITHLITLLENCKSATFGSESFKARPSAVPVFPQSEIGQNGNFSTNQYFTKQVVLYSEYLTCTYSLYKLRND